MSNRDIEDELMDEFHSDGNAASAEHELDSSQLWIVSFSDFMTILMILFLMLFANRVWSKKVAWEDLRMRQMRSMQESQQGMIQRLERLVDIDVAAQRVNIHLPESLLFDAGHAQLRIEAAGLLSDLAPEFQNFTGEIIVEGHSDNIPPGKSSKYHSNWELSVARSFSVIQHLLAQGVSPEKLSARGYGEFRPRAANDTSEGRAANRRIEIVLVNPKKPSLSSPADASGDDGGR